MADTSVTNLDVELICTHDDLIDEVGSGAELNNLLPRDQQNSSTRVRQRALEDVMLALARKTPPILDYDIGQPQDLRNAVAYGAMVRLYRIAMTSGAETDVYRAKMTEYKEMYQHEIRTMRIRSSGQQELTGVSTFTIERR